MRMTRGVLALCTATALGAALVGCERATGPGGRHPVFNRLGLTADTTPSDTTPPDTIPPDTLPPDTIPPDTIPPDTTPPPPPPDRGAKGVVQSATGSGHLTTAGELRTFTFSGLKRADGTVTGEFEFFSRSGNLRVHGDVICLQVVANRAWMGGRIRHSSDPTRARAGTASFWRVADNGEGGGAPPDQTSLMFVNQPPGSAEFYCGAMPPAPPLIPVQMGNIQVRDKTQSENPIP